MGDDDAASQEDNFSARRRRQISIKDATDANRPVIGESNARGREITFQLFQHFLQVNNCVFLVKSSALDYEEFEWGSQSEMKG